MCVTKVSIIVTTYNKPKELSICLNSLKGQTKKNFEVIIADDGSKEDTLLIISNAKKLYEYEIKHVWQQDLGFRKTTILNKAIKESIGEYIIFLDGDCFVQPDFVERHLILKENNKIITGSRILLNKKLSEEILNSYEYFSWENFYIKSFYYRVKNMINKLFPLFIKVPDNQFRKYKIFVWRRIKGCNLSVNRKDLELINGFNEELNGWGHEDADLVYRLYLEGVGRKSGSWSTEVLHLWHEKEKNNNSKENTEYIRKQIVKNKTKNIKII